jgi:hypothetical protein
MVLRESPAIIPRNQHSIPTPTISTYMLMFNLLLLIIPMAVMGGSIERARI